MSESDLTYTPNPNGRKPSSIASELWDSFVGDGGRFSRGTPLVLFELRREVEALAPCLDYLQQLRRVERAVEVFYQGRR